MTTLLSYTPLFNRFSGERFSDDRVLVEDSEVAVP